MSKKSKAVKKWRKNVKEKLINAFGGYCCVCGYSGCNDALALHHLDPSKKNFTFGKVIGNGMAWDKLVAEAKKCVLVCVRCHTEIHAGYTKVPYDAKCFNPIFEPPPTKIMDTCPICGKDKPIKNKTCSRSCAARKARKIDWDKYDIILMKTQGITNIAIGDMLDVSDVAVAKRLKKLGYLNLR